MSLSSIANDIKTHIESGEQWFAKVLGEHVPALVAEAEKIQGSVIFQALEGLILPPEVEAEIANVIKAFAAVVARVPAVAAAPAEVPAEPAAEPAADGAQSAM